MKRLLILLAMGLLLSACSHSDDSDSDGSNDDNTDDTVVGDNSDDEVNDNDGTGNTDDTCTYPEYTGALRMGYAIPPLSWEDAVWPDGSVAGLDFNSFYCGTDGTAYDSIVLVLSAGWCPACPDYLEYMNDLASQIGAANSMLLLVEVEDANYVLTTSAQADVYMDRHIDDGKGVRVGDASTLPRPGFFSSNNDIINMPSAYVIRRSDMKIIADQTLSAYLLDFPAIVQNPQEPWRPEGATLNCSAEDEEASEPNNLLAEAGALSPGTINGGICDFQPDFYSIDVAGEWQLDLSFQHSTGDLDVYVWDPSTNEMLRQNGQPVGSDSVDDNESFTYSGPATVRVFGYQRATCPYSITLTEL